ncbi:GTP-binding protein [Rhodococcus tukisamuensis]|nr:ATP/GTP-binding protein [Rhodococcus tukisamuensis]
MVVGGGSASAKTTLVGAVSEIVPLRTEALVTDASVGVDNLSATPQKSTTTVAMDFGRISLADDLVLYLFGTPGQHRFWFMWDDLIRGAIGAIVLIDTRRLDESFAAVDFFEARNLPFLIAVNEFDDAPRYATEDIRQALAVSPDVPIVSLDARDRESAKSGLVAVTEYALSRLSQSVW